eukprot:1381477-Pleurochrysis_carterae.AAC.2
MPPDFFSNDQPISLYAAAGVKPGSRPLYVALAPACYCAMAKRHSATLIRSAALPAVCMAKLFDRRTVLRMRY